MNEAEYFRQAFNDADFRRAKILEQREHKKLFGGFCILGVILVAALTAASLSDGKPLLSFVTIYINMLVVPAILYSTARVRLAALEAMEGKSPIAGEKSVPTTAS